MQKMQPVRGTHDILPEEMRKRRAMAQVIRSIAERYGFSEVQTPIFEFSDVFHRTLGDTSDIVSKETYTFEDRGGESLTLRPEFTACVVRAFLTGGLQNELPLKWYYHGPAFRYERPQKGRLRQFHQHGVELLGVAEPEADVEIIALGHTILQALGLAGKVSLELNSLGDGESRKAYREALVAYLSKHEAGLSEDSKMRLTRNPLRILDSKDAGDRQIVAGAPKLHESFTPEAHAFFNRVRSGLDALGIVYTVNQNIVRGLDYYNHTVFEFIAKEGLGAQNTVLAGGRYDGLVEQMGGNPTPGVGFGAGEERLLLAEPDWERISGWKMPDIIAVVPVGEMAENEASKLAYELRNAGFAVDMAYKGNTGKRMKRADKIGAKAAVMLGENELAEGKITLKILATGEQKIIARAELAGVLQQLTAND